MGSKSRKNSKMFCQWFPSSNDSHLEDLGSLRPLVLVRTKHRGERSFQAWSGSRRRSRPGQLWVVAEWPDSTICLGSRLSLHRDQCACTGCQRVLPGLLLAGGLKSKAGTGSRRAKGSTTKLPFPSLQKQGDFNLVGWICPPLQHDQSKSRRRRREAKMIQNQCSSYQNQNSSPWTTYFQYSLLSTVFEKAVDFKYCEPTLGYFKVCPKYKL